MLTKDDIIAMINQRLSLTTIEMRVGQNEHHAPMIHAIIGTLVDYFNDELKKIHDHLHEKFGEAP